MVTMHPLAVIIRLLAHPEHWEGSPLSVLTERCRSYNLVHVLALRIVFLYSPSLLGLVLATCAIMQEGLILSRLRSTPRGVL